MFGRSKRSRQEKPLTRKEKKRAKLEKYDRDGKRRPMERMFPGNPRRSTPNYWDRAAARRAGLKSPNGVDEELAAFRRMRGTGTNRGPFHSIAPFVFLLAGLSSAESSAGLPSTVVNVATEVGAAATTLTVVYADGETASEASPPISEEQLSGDDNGSLDWTAGLGATPVRLEVTQLPSPRTTTP